MPLPPRARRPVPDGKVNVAATPRTRLFVPSRGWGGSRRRRILFGAAGIAVLLHVLATITIIEAPHLFPSLVAPSPPPPPSSQTDPPTIEMVTDDNKYAGGSKAAPAVNPTPPAPKVPTAPPKPQAAPNPSDLPVTAPPSPQAETVPPDAPKKAVVEAPAPSPPKQEATPEPQINLDPADGLGYGRQDDPEVIPASPDNQHANKMPPYPRAAGRRGESGSVQMLVAVAADGSVSSVEVAVTSGYPDLDRAATNAVEHWHFRPAMQGGRSVPTQMMQVFNFKIDH